MKKSKITDLMGGFNMKYMTFNRSCSYACLANLLENYNIHKTDREIAIEMNLPYLFSYDDKTEMYLAGPMLQGIEWFNIYLNTIGIAFIEQELNKNDVPKYLRENPGDKIIGLNLDNGKHAVIFKGYTNDEYKFLNVKHENSHEPDFYTFSESDLLLRLDNLVHIGYINYTGNIIVS